MSNAEDGSRLESGDSAEPDDDIARLLALAGPRPRVPDEVTARVRAAVHAHWQQRVDAGPRRQRLLTAFLAAAALVVVGVGTSLWFASSGGSRPVRTPEVPPVTVAHVVALAGMGSAVTAPGEGRPVGLAMGGAVASGATVVTPASARVALRTSDGVSLRVDAASRVRLLSATRLQLESGAVYVDNPSTGTGGVRIEVRTPLGLASDVGTQFETRVNARELRVRVREGTVVVRRDAGTEGAKAGEELRIDTTGTVARRGLLPHDPEWTWVVEMAPDPAIEGRPLGELLAWAARETGWRVEFADQRLSRTAPGIVLHGSIEGLTPAAALAAVLPTCGLSHRVSGGAVWIEELPQKRP